MLNCFSILLLFLIVTPAYVHLHANEETDKPFNFKSPDDASSFQAVEHGEEYYGCRSHVCSYR